METPSLPTIASAANELYTQPTYFEKLNIYELKYSVCDPFDEISIETYHVAVAGSMEQVMTVSRLLIDDKTEEGELPLDYTLISITKVASIPFFGANSIRNYQAMQLKHVASKVGEAVPELKAQPEKLKTLVKGVLTEQYNFQTKF